MIFGTMAGPLNYTEQQAAAITTRNVSIALSAGAGCGKTFVLTQRFLKHLEPGAEAATLSSLVAITFTDRAAREMRDRVREACQQRLDDCAPDEVDHWLQVLRGLDTARISTIHSFCTSLLRAHAVEARLDPGFVLLEPPLADTMLESAAESVLHQRLIADEADANAFVLRFGLEKSRELIRQLARQRFRVEWSDWTDPTPDELAQRWITAWEQVYRPRLIEEFRTSPLVERLREFLAEHQSSHAEMNRRCDVLREGLQPKNPWPDPAAQLQELREAAKVQGGGGKSVWESEAVFEDIKTMLTALRGQIDKLVEQLVFNAEDVSLAAEFACHGFVLARQVAEAYETAKMQAGVLDFDDLLLQARNLLRDHPEARRRFAQSIRLLMVDEFQDTDPVQADIVRDLCGEALRHGKLFLVGDSKQSIYRFRRADPQVFEQLRQELPPDGRKLLTRNFRSQPEILNFVNLLFQDDLPDYEPLVPHHAQQSPLPTIEFLWASSDVDPAGQPADKVSAEALREREAEWIARRIAQLLADNTPRVRDKEPATGQSILRRIQPGDIVILFRALSNVQEYEQQLRDYGLDYYLVGGKTFYAQQEVFDLLNLCRCLDNPNDVVSLIGVLRSPFFGWSDDDLQGVCPDDGDWWTRLGQPAPESFSAEAQSRVHFAGQTLHRLWALKDELSILDLLTTAVALTGYDAALLLEFLGSRKVANLRKLIEQAATFDGSELFTLKDYVARLETSVLEETDEAFATTLPEAGDVIRLMSIHQSKGLEFPVVIVADLDRKPPPKTLSAYLHPQWGGLVKLPDRYGREFDHLGLTMLKIDESAADQEETLRLFYVAVTRAADHLILSAGREPGTKFANPWMELLASRFDLETGLPKSDPLLGTMVGATSRDSIPAIRPHHHPPDVQRKPHERDTKSLSDFRERWATATPEPLPESLNRYAIDPLAPRTWSISQLEIADALFLDFQPTKSVITAEQLTVAETLGTFLHEVLERLDYAQSTTWESTLSQQLKDHSGDAALQQTAQDVLLRLADSDIVQTWSAAAQLHRELSFLFPWPATKSGTKNEPDLISGQIDLLVQQATGSWSLYDFKTGMVAASKTDADVLAPYSFQLGVYAWAVENWLQQPLEDIALVLVRPQVRLVRMPWDAARKRDIEQRLTRAIQQARQELAST